MALTSGNKLGPYEILEAAGAGGMGEVYKAKDTRLDRTVAIKVLPQQIAENPDLRARFEREAKAISSLNHPNICTLHDVGHENGTEYLVMEYIEGETLATKLEQGPLALKETLEIGMQIADALDKAHRQGLVHRDLKPANVMLTKEGAKLLDFGLAKLKEEGGVIEGISGITRTTPLTGAGTILGTLQYMAPEQLEGQEADARADIFAFGALLYEMSTGQRAFDGKSQASLIAAILEREPTPISAVAPMSPPGLDRLVRKCLEKDPEKRWQSARDMSDELRWIAQSGSQAGISVQVSHRRKFRLRAAWGAAAVLGVAALILAYLLFMQPKPEIQIQRFALSTEEFSNVRWPRISPNGKLLAFQAADSAGTVSIWIRPLNSLQAYPLPGTENAGRPFWSPDSRFLAYFTNNQLRKVSAAGGPVQLVCEANGFDGCWGSSNIIVFDNSVGDSIQMVPASGGVATGATSLRRDIGEQLHAWPWFLPDGVHFLYVAQVDTASRAAGEYVVRVASLDGTVDKPLFRADSRIEYSKAGYILHSRDGVLMARPFDENSLEVTGEPVPIGENIATYRGAELFSASDNGLLTFQTGSTTGVSRLVWLDREGNELGTVGEPGGYRDLALSPAGDRVAYQMLDEQTQSDEIWVFDLRRNVPTRLTFDESNDVWPIWSPEGDRLIYASIASGQFRLMERQANGLGEPKTVLASETGNVGPSDWSRDGETIIMGHLQGEWDIWQLSAKDSGRYTEFTESPHNEWRAKLSPNGRYIAYRSDESGRSEIYVRELGSSGGKWQVSADEAYTAMWRGDGKELFYVNRDWDMMAVPVVTDGDHFEAGIPQKLFTRQYTGGGVLQFRFAVTEDGQRFLYNVPVSEAKAADIVVVLNWDEELKQQ